MIQYNDALDAAVSFFKENGSQEITAIYECKDRWIFFGGIPGLVNYGASAVYVMKNSLDICSFTLPDEENFNLLQNATIIMSTLPEN